MGIIKGNKVKDYTTIKIKNHDHEVMKDVKKLEGIPISIQIQNLLKEKYPNMYKKALTKESK